MLLAAILLAIVAIGWHYSRLPPLMAVAVIVILGPIWTETEGRLLRQEAPRPAT